MNVANVWPLGLLILIPGIILLYMLKQRSSDYPFSSIILWKELYRNQEATRPWERFRNQLLMYLQIAVILCLILIFMGPYLKRGGNGFGNVVISIDNSASMGYIYHEDKTRFDEAKERACDYVKSLPEGTEVTIVSCATEPVIVCTNLTDPSEVCKRIREIPLTDLPGDGSNAVSMLSSITSQWEKYEAVILTDQGVDVGGLHAKVLNLYTQGINVSVDYVNCGVDENGIQIVGKVTNHSEEAVVRDVNLYGDEELLTLQTLSLEPLESKVFYFTVQNFEGTLFCAQLQEQDALASDNTAYAVLRSNEENQKVLLVTDGNIFLEKAIGALDWIDLYKSNDASVIENAEGYALYVLDNKEFGSIPDTGNILYINPKSNTFFQIAEQVEGVLMTFQPTDITRYVEGWSIGVNHGSVFEGNDWAKGFLNSGDKVTGIYGETAGRRIAALGFDLHETDFALQAEYPILMSNLMDYLLTTGMVSDEPRIAGDSVTFRGNIKGEPLKVVSPDKQETSLDAMISTKAYTDTAYAGVYQVSQMVESEKREEQFVIRFPVDSESGNEEKAVEQQGDANEKEFVGGGRDLRSILIILALILVAAEWLVYMKQH